MVDLVKIVLLGSLLSATANARVIYGEDNRIEVSEASAFHQKLAQGTATMVSSRLMLKDPFISGTYHLDQTPLGSRKKSSETPPTQLQDLLALSSFLKGEFQYCEEERFVEQPNVGECTGFLIAEDLIVTAGHCVALEDFCEEYKWIFGYQLDPETKTAGLSVPSENIYSCKTVRSNDLSMPLGLDYAIVELDRKVTNREPLSVRTESTLSDSTPLMIIGSPTGLPLKVADGASVIANSHPFYFSASLDSYTGNSGSPVLDAETGLIEGILVRGDEDFVGNIKERCMESKRCKEGECRGEEITRTTAIPEIALQKILNQAALEGDLETLENILSLDTWVDFYTKDGVTALMMAAQGNQIEVMKKLIAQGADVHRRDAYGNTLIHFAAKSNNLIAIEYLLQMGLDINAKDQKGETILFTFARLGNTEAIGRLLKLGANGHVLNNDGITFLDIDQVKNQLIVTQ